mmetsp:Transcript_47200/g.157275  ORF Transcript_47200/g.157275 Transcript_47200/m.157275 type:complete len:119 (+) Transcript_47200:434-790(+)
MAAAAGERGAAISPCELRLLELTPQNAAQALSEVDVLFAFSTCFDGATFAAILAAGLKSGAVAITIDIQCECCELDAAGFELLYQVDHLPFASIASLAPELAEELGEFESTAYVWRKR